MLDYTVRSHAEAVRPHEESEMPYSPLLIAALAPSTIIPAVDAIGPNQSVP